MQIRISSGAAPAGFRPVGSPRLTAAEKEARFAQHQSAMDLATAGDDSALRLLTLERFAVECVSDVGKDKGDLRHRKFSNPLFLAPVGLLNAFPEVDEDLFCVLDLALDKLKKLAVDGEWEVRQTTLAKELRGKRFQRWLLDVKGGPYKEPRRSLEELASIHALGGVDALLRLYSKAHALKIVKRLEGRRPTPPDRMVG